MLIIYRTSAALAGGEGDTLLWGDNGQVIIINC